MRKTIFAALLLLFCLHLSANWVQLSSADKLFELKRSSSNKTEFTFNLTGYEIEELSERGVDYSKISHPLGGELLEIGRPDLPIFTTFIAIPDNGSPQLDINYGQITSLNNVIPYPRTRID